MTTDRTLKMHTVVPLAEIVRWAQGGTRIVWLDNNRDVRTGTVRCICDEAGNLLADDEDVRDAYVRITTDDGIEWFAPMQLMIDMRRLNEIAED